MTTPNYVIEVHGAEDNFPIVLRPNAYGDETDIRTQSPISATWAALTAYILGNKVKPISGIETVTFECTTAGTSGAGEPVWDTTIGNTTADGTVIWTTRSLHWDKVDEVVSDGNATIVHESRAVYHRDLYNIGIATIGRPISAIKVCALCRSAVIANQANLKICCKIGGVVYESDPIVVDYSLTFAIPTPLGKTTLLYSKLWAKNPFTNRAWIEADITNLQIGISLRSPDSGGAEWTVCTQVYVEVQTYGLLAILENAFNVSYMETINQLGSMKFELPADDAKLSYLLPENELWLYSQGQLVDIYKLKRRGTIRD